MDSIYTWLFEHYALPELKAMEEGQDEVLMELAGRLGLSQKPRRRFLDLAENMRLQWGAGAFALGVRFGMALAAPQGPEEDCSWLLQLLPQLDQPVAQDGGVLELQHL